MTSHENKEYFKKSHKVAWALSAPTPFSRSPQGNRIKLKIFSESPNLISDARHPHQALYFFHNLLTFYFYEVTVDEVYCQ